MERIQKQISILLLLVLCFLSIPVYAADSAKEGESKAGINLISDREKTVTENIYSCAKKSVAETVYDNKEMTISEAVYGSDTRNLRGEPLQIVELFPADGATEVEQDTQLYITFNKPVDFVYLNDKGDVITPPPPFCFHIQVAIGGSGGEYKLLEHNEDKTIWYLPAGTLNLEKGKEYTVAGGPFTKVKAEEIGEILYIPNWRFNTKIDIPPEEQPASIKITDYPLRLSVGDKYPLQAVVENKEGNVLADYKVNWEAVSVTNGKAVVDKNGYLEGTQPGIVRLIARADKFPNVADGIVSNILVEIRENFPNHLTNIWSVALNNREDCAEKPLIGADGTIYLITKAGGIHTVKAYDQAGETKSGFMEITDFTEPPVLAEIAEEEYLIGPQGKKMCAFYAATGRLKWQSEELEYEIHTMAAVSKKGNIYAGCSNDRKLYAFNFASTRPLWYKFTGINTGFHDRSNTIPTINLKDRIYTIGGNDVYCLDSTGKLQWHYETPGHGTIASQVQVDEENNVYFIEKITTTEYILYSLNEEGEYRWQLNNKGLLQNIFIDEDDSLYVTIRDLEKSTQRLTCLNKEDGSVMKKIAAFACDKFLRAGDGTIYTNKFIFNSKLEPIAYADDYYHQLPYMHYSKLALCPDGTLVRVVISEGFAIALEKLTLFDTSDSVPAAIEAEQEFTLYQGWSQLLHPQVKDGEGHILPHIGVTYVSDNPDIAAVDEQGKITAQGTGDTFITIKVKGHEDVTSIVNVHVLPQEAISRVYFVKHHPDKSKVNIKEEIKEVTGVCGEEQCIQFVAVDQYDQVIENLPIKWTITEVNSSIVQMRNYSGGVMGSQSKSIAVLNGLKCGTGTITAELDNQADTSPKEQEQFKKEITVQINPAPYEILWNLPIEGAWEKKVAYHTQNEKGVQFISNASKVRAVDDTGYCLWEKNVGVKYGVYPSCPVADERNIYVCDNSKINKIMLALSQEDGSLQWSFDQGLGSMVKVLTDSKSIYIQTDDNRVYKLNKNGHALWENPLKLKGQAANIALSSAEELYYAAENGVFRVNEDKVSSKLYTDPEDVELTIKEITEAGSIILQKVQEGSYSIISLSTEGKKNWEVSVERPVELSCDSKEIVYAVTRLSEDKQKRKQEYLKLYIVEKDGNIKAETVLANSPVRTDYDYVAYYKPQIGSDGVVYIPVTRLYAVDAKKGTLLWQAEFKDGYFKRVPKTATIDQNNVIYLACDDAGFLAVKSKGTAIIDESGFGIEVLDSYVIKPNTYRNMRFNIKNENKEERDVTILIGLEDLEKDSFLTYASFTDTLAVGYSTIYNCGLNIPREGSYLVKIKLLDQDRQVLTEKELPVR